MEKRSVLIQNYNLSQLQTSKVENQSKNEHSKFKLNSDYSTTQKHSENNIVEDTDNNLDL